MLGQLFRNLALWSSFFLNIRKTSVFIVQHLSAALMAALVKEAKTAQNPLSEQGQEKIKKLYKS